MAANPKIIEPVSIVDPTTPSQQVGVDSSGRLQVVVSTATGTAQLTSASVSFSASGDTTLVAAVSAKITRVYRLMLTIAGATTLTFKDGASALTGAMNIGPGGGSLVLDFSSEPWFTGSTNTNFILNSSAAVQVSGRIYYTNT